MRNGRGSLENADFILVATLICSRQYRAAQLGATVRLQNCIVCGAHLWSSAAAVRMWAVGKSCWEEEGGEQGMAQSNPSLEDFSFFHSLKRKRRKIIFLKLEV